MFTYEYLWLIHVDVWQKTIQSVQFSCAVMSPTLCDPMNRSTPGLPPITNSWSSLKLTSIESVMPSSHLIRCRPLISGEAKSQPCLPQIKG